MSRTKKSRSASALLMGLAMLMTLFVVPAAAQDAGVTVARGRAFIGYETAPQGCVTQVGPGDGLLFPVDVDPANPTIAVNPPRTRCYAFDTNEKPVGPPDLAEFCQTVGIIGLAPLSGDCRIVAHGNVSGWCGHSAGTLGRGRFTSPAVSPHVVDLELSALTWLPSVGSVLVVRGLWTDGGSKSGEIVALVQASGNTCFGNMVESCSDRSLGADSFDVNVVAALVETL